VEICVGVVAAGVVLALSDLGHARERLAGELAAVSSAISAGFLDCFVVCAEEQPRFQSTQRDLLGRVIALDPMIDTAFGEASDLRYRSPILQSALTGLFETLSAWRKVARQLGGA